MSARVSDTAAMIAGMAPELRPGTYAFVTHATGTPWPAGTLASFVEAEGLSLVVPAEAAPPEALPMRLITLAVHSALDGVGLTAAVATALARAGIPANIVAAHHHDHVLVPSAQAGAAIATLQALQAQAAE